MKKEKQKKLSFNKMTVYELNQKYQTFIFGGVYENNETTIGNNDGDYTINLDGITKQQGSSVSITGVTTDSTNPTCPTYTKQQGGDNDK